MVTVGDIHWTGFRDARIARLAQIHSGTADLASLDADAARYLEEARND